MPFSRKRTADGIRIPRPTCEMAIYSWLSGVYRNAVHARKMKVLKKLRALLEGSIEQS